ncbi:MAG: glycosyltransferase [Bacilli bacterium]|nr:glycosyltransferase [Bacilli bacterium]
MFYNENISSADINKLKKYLGFSKKDFVLIFVGRLAEEKNVEFLLSVVKKLYKNYSHLKLLVVGDGPDKEKYEKISKDNGTDKNVIFTGKVPWEDIPIYYQISNGFITASTSETQGLTVIEAMAASLPALCINDESFNSTVINDLNGFIFNDEEECIKVIIKLLENKELQKELAIGAKSSAEMHSSKYFAEKVLDVYNKAIETNKNKFQSKFTEFMKRVTSWKK